MSADFGDEYAFISGSIPGGPPDGRAWSQHCAAMARRVFPELEQRYGPQWNKRVTLRFEPDGLGQPKPKLSWLSRQAAEPRTTPRLAAPRLAVATARRRLAAATARTYSGGRSVSALLRESEAREVSWRRPGGNSQSVSARRRQLEAQEAAWRSADPESVSTRLRRLEDECAR